MQLFQYLRFMKYVLVLLLILSLHSFGQTEILNLGQYEERYNSMPGRGIKHLLNSRTTYGQWKGAGRNKLAYNLKTFALEKGLDFESYNIEKSLHITFELGREGEFKSVVYWLEDFSYDDSTKMMKRFFYDEYPAGLESKLRTVIGAFCQSYKMNSLSLNSEFYPLNLRLNKQPKKPSPESINSVQEAFETTRPDTVTKVDFSELDLQDIPVVLFRFENLKKLDLSENKLKELPRDLWRFENLTELDVSKNLLGNESFHFKRNKSLEVLNLQFNRISEMPDGIWKLKSLKDVLLGNNQLLTFSEQRFRKMPALRSLNLYNGELKDYPVHLDKLENLEELDFYYNALTLISPEIGKLKHLKRLALSNNKIWKLPEEIGQLQHLEFLYVHHNKLRELPGLSSTVTYLDIGYNNFIEFPESVYSLNLLNELDVSNNAILKVPIDLSKNQSLSTLFINNNPFEKDKRQHKAFADFVVNLEKNSVKVR